MQEKKIRESSSSIRRNSRPTRRRERRSTQELRDLQARPQSVRLVEVEGLIPLPLLHRTRLPRLRSLASPMESRSSSRSHSSTLG